MNRRDLITLLGGAAAAWPLAVRAEQPPMPVIGFLGGVSPDGVTERLRAFRDGLKDSGYIEGENVTIIYRWADNQLNLVPELASELRRQQVAVIIALGGNAGALAAKAVTTTIPILFIATEDPVRLGLVSSLARPGGNVTGINLFSGELSAKRLEFLRELVPAATRVAVLVNPTGSTAETTLRDVEAAARPFGLQIRALNANTSREIDAALATFVPERPEGLFVSSDPFLTSRRVQLANLAAHHSVPMTSATREMVEVGGLMSYGSNIADAFRQVGVYAGRILKGAKPAELPVVQANKFELVINAQTARMLRLTVPASLLATADEVIE